MDYRNYPFARQESLMDSYVIASYLIFLPDAAGAFEKAGAFAVGQSIGTWLKVPGISGEMVERYQGRVLSMQDVSPEQAQDKRYLLRIAFPMANFGGSLTMMMTALVGNDVSTSLTASLVNLEFVNGAETAFSGPKQGMEELRALTGVYDRPLVLNMIKPCAGFTPEEGAALFRQVALGGVDLVKDDELLGSPVYNPVGKRTELYLKVAQEAAEETGRQTIYLPNITGRPSQIRENIRRVIDLGAKACLFNFVFAGLDTLLETCEEFGDKIFIMAHYAGVGVMNGARGGISNSVMLGTLPRLAGAHAMMTMYPNKNNPAAVYDFIRTVQAQSLPMGKIRPVISTVGGGITPINQAFVQQQLGHDSIIGIGGAIQGHPMGATLGAEAAMAAVKATACGITLEDAAEGCAPLQTALKLWG